MTKPDDIPQDVWEKAIERTCNCAFPVDGPTVHDLTEAIARTIMAAKEEAEAERDMLQDILDGRPAINAALPDSYIRWSQAIYSGDFVRASIRKLGEAD